LTAVAPGYPNAAYQWTKDGVAIDDATSDTYHVDALSTADTGWYTCQLTDSGKYLLTLPAVHIEVFPQGSLPAAGYAALFLTAAACVLLAILRRRHVPARH
jgi:hypothetical protein